MFKKWGVASLLACLVGPLVGCTSGGQNVPTPTPLPQVVSQEKTIFTVERGPIVSQREVAGEIYPAQQDELFFRTPGYIGRVLVKTGDIIKKGDILAELQMDDLLDQLQQARIDLEVSQNNLAMENLQRAYDIQQAESEVVICQKQVDLAKIRLEKSTVSQKDDAQLNLDIALERLKTAQAYLNLVKGRVSSNAEQVVKRNQLALDHLERLVEERQLIAPYDGIVIHIFLFPGTRAEAFQQSALVGDPSRLVIQIPYDYELVTTVDANTAAYLNLTKSKDQNDALVRQYPVKFIPDFLPITNKKEGLTIEGDEITLNYLFFSVPDDLPRDLVPVGSRVNLLVVLGSKEDALLLHPAAIRGNDTFRYVIVLEDDYHRRVEVVEIGAKTKDRWEIIANLKEGDQVLGP